MVAESASAQARQSAVLHSQVMKIREEEENIGNTIAESFLSLKDRAAMLNLTAQMKEDFVNNSRPAIPSPLGLKQRAGDFSFNR
ncbi:hypothetical protein SUGI_1101250 [Cryptomeria japonica]|nr:hypothetical protein SUGI_1101250 [Cryptomeria japonica]